MSEQSEIRTKGLETMSEVYGFDMQDGEGAFFDLTVDHLFGDIWNRPGLSRRDRRLLLIGVLAAAGKADVLGIQLPAARGNGELDDDQLREIVVFLSHYVGWPTGAELSMLVEKIIGDARRAERRAEGSS